MISYEKLFLLLERNGYNTTRIRKEKVIGQATYYGLKDGSRGLDHRSINHLCKLLSCQPGDIMEYIPDNEKDVK